MLYRGSKLLLALVGDVSDPSPKFSYSIKETTPYRIPTVTARTITHIMMGSKNKNIDRGRARWRVSR